MISFSEWIEKINGILKLLSFKVATCIISDSPKNPFLENHNFKRRSKKNKNGQIYVKWVITRKIKKESYR